MKTRVYRTKTHHMWCVMWTFAGYGLATKQFFKWEDAMNWACRVEKLKSGQFSSLER